MCCHCKTWISLVYYAIAMEAVASYMQNMNDQALTLLFIDNPHFVYLKFCFYAVIHVITMSMKEMNNSGADAYMSMDNASHMPKCLISCGMA
jgi:hypothetical protein